MKFYISGKVMQSYVYKGKEVFLTGRSASKPSRRGDAKIVYEIKPIRFLNAERDTSYIAEWVSLSELYMMDDSKLNEENEENE